MRLFGLNPTESALIGLTNMVGAAVIVSQIISKMQDTLFGSTHSTICGVLGNHVSVVLLERILWHMSLEKHVRYLGFGDHPQILVQERRILVNLS